MIASRRRSEEQVAAPIAATGLLFAGATAFAIGKYVRDRRKSQEDEWSAINID